LAIQRMAMVTPVTATIMMTVAIWSGGGSLIAMGGLIFVASRYARDACGAR